MLFCNSSSLFPLELSGTSDAHALPPVPFQCCVSWWYLLASPRPCHQILSAITEQLGPISSQRLCLLLLNLRQNPNLFPSHLIGGKYQYTILWFLYLSFVFLHINQKSRLSMCFTDCYKALLTAGCVWGGKLWGFFLELFFFTLVNEWSVSCSSTPTVLWNWISQKDVYVSKLLIYIIYTCFHSNHT